MRARFVQVQFVRSHAPLQRSSVVARSHAIIYRFTVFAVCIVAVIIVVSSTLGWSSLQQKMETAFNAHHKAHGEKASRRGNGKIALVAFLLVLSSGAKIP